MLNMQHAVCRVVGCAIVLLPSDLWQGAVRTSEHSLPRAPRMAMTVLTAQPTSPLKPGRGGTHAAAFSASIAAVCIMGGCQSMMGRGHYRDASV